MKKQPFVSIVICTQNRARALKKYLLPSIEKLNYKNYEVVVVDDASKDNTIEIIQSYKSKIKSLKIVKNKKSRGLCYARNLGIKHSKGDIIAFTDDDCYVDKNWLKELIKAYDNKNVTGAGGKIYFRDSRKIMNTKKEVFGCNMSFKKEIFDKFQFDVNMNKSHKYDEIEFIERLKGNNLKIIHSNLAIVNHFRIPGKHREKTLFGEPLNIIYLYAKRISLFEYYRFVLRYAFISTDNKRHSSFEHGIVYGIHELKKAFRSKKRRIEIIKLPWFFYVLFFEIPLKSRKNYSIKRK